MENKEKLEKIYSLYNSKNYTEANELNNEILAIEPDNIYAKRYSSLLLPYLQKSYSKEDNWKITKVKGKKLLCPHCKSGVAFSSLNQEQKTKIRNNEYNNLELKCPYCHTNFVLQKRTSNSILWIKLWDIITYNKKTYRTVWYVKYSWKWNEWNYSWKTEYLEWILLWKDNSYLYFSEWTSIDDWDIVEEFEFSYKIVPDFTINADYSLWYVKINWSNVRFSESTHIKTISIYWENSKYFKVWEKVDLYYFSYNWKKYVIEKEWAWRQAEAWIYETNSVNKNISANYFWKKNDFSNNFSNNNKWLVNNNLWWLIIILFILWGVFINYIYYIIWFIFLWWLIYFIFVLNWVSTKIKNIVLAFIIWPVFSFFIVQPIFNFILEDKQKITIDKIIEWKKYEINFKHKELMNEKIDKTVRYDYWWIKTYYNKNTWLKFSVLSEEDKKIVENIKWLWNEKNNSNISKMFSWDIYKLK